MTEIIRLAARGDGVTADGRFVLGAAVGDTVRFDGDGVTIEPGPNHQTPPCRHVPDCGGCQLQHLTDNAYIDFVSSRLLGALRHVGITPESVAPVSLSPPQSRRRASMRAVKRGGRLTLGFNAESSHSIVDIEQCAILLPSLFNRVAPLRAMLRQSIGEGQGAGITLTASDSGTDVLLANVAAQSLAQIERSCEPMTMTDAPESSAIRQTAAPTGPVILLIGEVTSQAALGLVQPLLREIAS